MTKKCTNCKLEKPLEDFYKEKRNPIKKTSKTEIYKSACKDCSKKRTEKYVKENREKVNEYQLSYYHKKRNSV